MSNKKEKIVNWLIKRADLASVDGFVIGVSGGVDSALTSTLCALTGKKVVVAGLHIHQPVEHISRSEKHMQWLEDNFSNVKKMTIDITKLYESFVDIGLEQTELALANARSRLRMTVLYSIANTNNLLVAGTGNKIEDYGIGFFTKYGDGGVDISPIADLLKSEVRKLSKDLGVSDEIVNAIPTDGLWADDRSDEQQIGASYEELEWALKYYDENSNFFDSEQNNLSLRQKEVLDIYTVRHLKNKHKMELPAICMVS
jgi:NAD+ synthase